MRLIQRTAIIIVAPLLTAFLTGACGRDNNLTRARAEILIEQHGALKIASIRITPRSFKRAFETKLWPERYVGIFGQLAPPPEPIFKVIREGALLTSMGSASVVLAAPLIKWKVSVTGIADLLLLGGSTGTAKEVQFTVLPTDLPAWLVPDERNKDGGRGQAVLRLYDDGWRVENAEFSSPVFDVLWEKIPGVKMG